MASTVLEATVRLVGRSLELLITLKVQTAKKKVSAPFLVMESSLTFLNSSKRIFATRDITENLLLHKIASDFEVKRKSLFDTSDLFRNIFSFLL